MAQEYEIDIKRFNGQDYDTLLPTPAAHAATHQANGSDPITMQTGNYGPLSIPTSAYQNASVSRAKLANDALYSPFVTFSSGDTIGTSHIGKKLRDDSNADYILNVAADPTIPNGAEIAVFRLWSSSLNIIFGSGTKVALEGETGFLTAPTISIPEKYSTIAMEKVMTYEGYDIWHVLGNVEVVS